MSPGAAVADDQETAPFIGLGADAVREAWLTQERLGTAGHCRNPQRALSPRCRAAMWNAQSVETDYLRERLIGAGDALAPFVDELLALAAPLVRLSLDPPLRRG